MFLDTFCNDKQGWGPKNADNNDLTPCAQGWLVFAPINLIFIILAIVRLYRIYQSKTNIKPFQIQHRVSVLSTDLEHNKMIGGVCNFDFVLCVLFTLGFSYALCTAIILPFTNSNDHLNWLIFTLCWELLAWILFTCLFYIERRYVIFYGLREAPSTLVRWFWVIQFILSLKHFESVLIAKYVNHTQHTNAVFYIQLFQLVPFAILLLRTILLKPTQSQLGMCYDSQFYPSKLSLQPVNEQHEIGHSQLADKMLRKYNKTTEENANLLSILTFNWLSGVFVTGYQRPLEMEDLTYLRAMDHSHETLKLFYKSWREQLESARQKNANYAATHYEPQEEKSNQQSVQVLTEPLLRRQQSDQTSMPKHIKIDEDAKYKPSLIKTLLSAFGGPFFQAGPLKLIYDCFQYAGPLILSAYLSDAEKFDSGEKADVNEAYMYAGLLFFVYLCATFILAQYFHRCFRTGMRVRSALMSACYEKALKLTQGARGERTQGEMMNIITVDVRKMRDVFPYCWMLISAPFQIGIAIYLLYQQIGWSVFMGLAMQLVFMAPLQMLVGVNARKLQKLVMKKRDKRMEVINEVFGAMKIVKMYAWEKSFGDKIGTLRKEELSILRCYIWWFSLMSLFWGFAPTLVALASFMTYTAAGHTLTAANTFTSIALFNLLRFPLAMLPMVIIAFIEANVCLGRIRKFLSASEIDPNLVEYAPLNKANKGNQGNKGLLYENEEEEPVGNEYGRRRNAIELENVTATWDDEMNQVALGDINVIFKEGTTSMIIGETGSGKSALLRAVLGNLTKSNGRIIYGESASNPGHHIKVAYSSQVAWIRNATVKDNILFGSDYNAELYNAVIRCCALIDDLKILPGGDHTEIGEKGINLSGGQKQRISLARAVYSNADVYVFDDPLSAVDSHVANHIFNECFIGLLKGKTIILATHAVSFLKYADNVVVMEHGLIKLQGKLQDLIDAKINLTAFIIHKNEEDEEESDAKEDENELLSSPKSPKQRGSPKTKSVTDDRKTGELVKEEERGVGDVSFGIYYLYVKAAGGLLLCILYLFFLSSFYGAYQMGNFWLAFLSNDQFKGKSNWWYMDIYCVIQGVALCFLVLITVTALITRLKASKYLFEVLLSKMLRAPMYFFDTTPIGRIINRFSRDIYAVDTAIPSSYQSALRITVSLVFTAIAVCLVTPWFALSILPLSVLYYYLQKYFIAASRELRRLSTLMNSPIYSNFAESINGVDVIKAFGKSDEFSDKNKNMVDKDHQAYYPSVAGNRWLAIRLEFIGNCLIGFAALFCAITKPKAGYVGVALSTIMGITQGLNWFVRQKAQLEQDIVSVERIDQYSNEDTVQEAAAIVEHSRPPKTWPSHGNIRFDNVWMKYRVQLEYVLKGLSFDIRGGEKIGVIGRTGAGKSSLFVTLLRIVEIEKHVNENEKMRKCEILIDGINVADIGLEDLRSRISVIPQDPILFTGTIRFNLDPFKTRNDNDLVEALKHSHVYEALRKMIIEITVKKERDEKDKEEKQRSKKKKKKNGKAADENSKKKHLLINDTGIQREASISQINIKQYLNDPAYKDLNPLDIEVEENGSNFSVGQRQLICLARAIVRRSKILLLDEATSAVDPQTDQLIQTTIRQEFKTNTILTIAHRIDTILDYDRILIMDQGHVLEYDTPQHLLSNENSRFSEIVQASFGVNLQDVLKNKVYSKNSGFGKDLEEENEDPPLYDSVM